MRAGPRFEMCDVFNCGVLERNCVVRKKGHPGVTARSAERGGCTTTDTTLRTPFLFQRSSLGSPSMQIGVLTGGGDCPGLNAVIRAVVRKGVELHGDRFVGFRDGWRGPLEGDTVPLDVSHVRGILPQGGTILGSSRTNPYGTEDGERRVFETVERLGLDGLIAYRGRGHARRRRQAESARRTDHRGPQDDRQRPARDGLHVRVQHRGHHRHRGDRPAAYDGGEPPPGVDRRSDGRHSGWIAIHSGIAGGANVILIPEQPFRIDEVCAFIEHRFASQYAPIVVVAEGALPAEGTLPARRGEVDAFGHERLMGIGLAAGIRDRSSAPARRPAVPSSATCSAVAPRRRSTGSWRRGSACTPSTRSTTGTSGQMVAVHGTAIELVPLSEATAELKLVPPELYAEARCSSARSLGQVVPATPREDAIDAARGVERRLDQPELGTLRGHRDRRLRVVQVGGGGVREEHRDDERRGARGGVLGHSAGRPPALGGVAVRHHHVLAGGVVVRHARWDEFSGRGRHAARFGRPTWWLSFRVA